MLAAVLAITLVRLLYYDTHSHAPSGVELVTVTFRATNSFLPAIETQYSTGEVYSEEPVIQFIFLQYFFLNLFA